MHACMLTCFSHVRLCVILWIAACQAPLSMGFSKVRILEWIATPSSSHDYIVECQYSGRLGRAPNSYRIFFFFHLFLVNISTLERFSLITERHIPQFSITCSCSSETLPQWFTIILLLFLHFYTCFYTVNIMKPRTKFIQHHLVQSRNPIFAESIIE